MRTKNELKLHGQVLVLSKNGIVRLDVISVNKQVNLVLHTAWRIDQRKRKKYNQHIETFKYNINLWL